MGVDGLSCGTHSASARGVVFAVIAVLVAPKDLGLNTPKNFNSLNFFVSSVNHLSSYEVQ